MKKLLILFALSTVSSLALPSDISAQTITKLTYYQIEMLDYDKISGRFKLTKILNERGSIVLKDNELKISSDGNIETKEFKIISQHRDNGSNLKILICEQKNGMCTIAISSEGSTMSILEENTKLTYKLKR